MPLRGPALHGKADEGQGLHGVHAEKMRHSQVAARA